jgi:hypothetical protein
MSYFSKYLKYKNKYINLKNIIQGGGCEYTTTIPMDERYKGNTLGDCYICDINNRILDHNEKRYLLENKDSIKIGERYIFAIGISEPEKIYIFPNSEQSKKYHCRKMSKIRITHNCLVRNNENVISAGTINLIDKDTIEISHDSGHYKPNFKSLDYVECLLKKIGFLNIIKNELFFDASPPIVISLPSDKIF